ncbi:hypothetical protein M514_05829 [Trichuris suis]|uniref:Uncharacterized protein n=1 Tax=Trichuris suis TaxID=68888 RepID=A0A085M802_9BILA|nr:hypothetical protein M513_05829 [Trichuris suis]KFD66444.1 hypothetical protein M514_05829 [Trichuris suis]
MNVTLGKDNVSWLNGGNYMCSKTKVKAILIRGILQDVVSIPTSEIHTSAWQKQDNKAMAFTTLSAEVGQFLRIANCDTAFEVWEKLQKRYARFKFGSQLHLRRKLQDIRFT